MSEVKTTALERKAIERLRKAIQKMPPTLWLYNTGEMNVMKYRDDGEQAMRPNGAIDDAYKVADIEGIFSEGGDW